MMKKSILLLLVFFLLFISSCKYARIDSIENQSASESSHANYNVNYNQNSNQNEQNNIDFEMINNQNNSIYNSSIVAPRLFAVDKQLYYLSNDGYYIKNNNKSKKLLNYNLSYCMKKDNWIYALTYYLDDFATENHYNYLIRFSTKDNKVEKVIAKKFLMYTIQKILFFILLLIIKTK
jgi:hypothetical protein